METPHLLQKIPSSASPYFLLGILPLHIFLIYFAIIRLLYLCLYISYEKQIIDSFLQQHVITLSIATSLN